MEALFGINKNFWAKEIHQGAQGLSTRQGAPPPVGRAPYLVGPLDLHRPQLQLYIFRLTEKKSERKFHRVLRHGAAAKP